MSELVATINDSEIILFKDGKVIYRRNIRKG